MESAELVYPKFEFNDKEIIVSDKVVMKIVSIIEESYLIRSLLILNNRNKLQAAKDVNKIINNFFDFITSREKTKKIIDPEVVSRYDYFIHMANFKQLYYILSYIPNSKMIKLENAKFANIFYYHLNVSGYYKRRINKISKSESNIKLTVNNLYKEFIGYYEEIKKENAAMDLDSICKVFFETKLKTKRKA